MSDDNKLVAEVRDQFGKGAARKIRAKGQVPAVIYGHGTDPVHIALPGHESLLALRAANACGALASPSTMVSRLLILPDFRSPPTSVANSPISAAWSEMMKPWIVSRFCTMANILGGPAIGSLS